MNNFEALVVLASLLPMPIPENEEYGKAFIDCIQKIEVLICYNPNFQEYIDVDRFIRISEDRFLYLYDFLSELEEDIDLILEYLDDLRCKPC